MHLENKNVYQPNSEFTFELFFSLFPPKTVYENIIFYMMLQQNVIIFKIFNITLQIIMVKFSNKLPNEENTRQVDPRHYITKSSIIFQNKMHSNVKIPI